MGTCTPAQHARRWQRSTATYGPFPASGAGYMRDGNGAVAANRAKSLEIGAGATGLEPATSGVTGRRSNQLNYAPWRAAQCSRSAPLALVGNDLMRPMRS